MIKVAYGIDPGTFDVLFAMPFDPDRMTYVASIAKPQNSRVSVIGKVLMMDDVDLSMPAVRNVIELTPEEERKYADARNEFINYVYGCNIPNHLQAGLQYAQPRPDQMTLNDSALLRSMANITRGLFQRHVRSDPLFIAYAEL